MKYSVGDRVKITEDGWGCGLQHVGMSGVVESVPTSPCKNYTLRMEDGSTLYEMWEQGFQHKDAERDYKPAKMIIDNLIPHDWQHPDWEDRTKVHDWKNYVETTFLEDMWSTFDDNQKKVLAYNFQLIADGGEWSEDWSTEVESGHRESLQEVLEKWSQELPEINFYSVGKSVEYVITEQDLEE